MKYLPAPLTPFLASTPDNSHPLQINPSPIAFLGRNSNTAVSYSYKLLVVAKKSELLCNQANPNSFTKTPGVGGGVPLRHLRVLCVSALSFAVVTPVFVFKSLQIAPFTPSICIPFIFINLQIAFFATRLFSKTSALPPSFSESDQIRSQLSTFNCRLATAIGRAIVSPIT